MFDLVFFDIETYSPGGKPTVNDKIITITYSINDASPIILKEWNSSEKKILEKFLNLIKKMERPVIIGHNIFGFDIPAIITRASGYGLGSIFELNTLFTSNFVVDTIQCLLPSNNMRFNGLGLTNCGEKMGTINNTCHGRLICNHYENSNWAEIIDHNVMDVIMTRDLYNLLTKSNYIPF